MCNSNKPGGVIQMGGLFENTLWEASQDSEYTNSVDKLSVFAYSEVSPSPTRLVYVTKAYRLSPQKSSAFRTFPCILGIICLSNP